MASFTERMIGAAKLDVRTYEEVEADTGALGQAMGVVVLQSIASGIGSLAHGGVTGLVFGTIAGLIGWFLWAAVIFVVGTKLLPEPQTRSDVPELMRTIGFASAPGLLMIFGVIPILGGLVSLGVSIWMLVAMVIAVRQALDYKSTGRAVGVCVLGWLIYVISFGVLLFLLGAGR